MASSPLRLVCSRSHHLRHFNIEASRIICHTSARAHSLIDVSTCTQLALYKRRQSTGQRRHRTRQDADTPLQRRRLGPAAGRLARSAGPPRVYLQRPAKLPTLLCSGVASGLLRDGSSSWTASCLPRASRTLSCRRSSATATSCFAMSCRETQRRYGWDDKKAFQQSSLRIICREVASKPEFERKPSHEGAGPPQKKLRLRYKQPPRARHPRVDDEMAP